MNDKMKTYPMDDAYSNFVCNDNKTGWASRDFFDAGWQAALSQSKPEVNQPVRCRCGLSTNCNGDDDGCIDPAMGRIIKPQVSQPVANNLLTQLLDSVEGNCYMGKEWELDTCKSLRKISPLDYEALKAQLVRSEADNTRLQSQYDEMRLKCSRRPAVAENEALKAENVRLQSEYNLLKEELNAWKIGYGSKSK